MTDMFVKVQIYTSTSYKCIIVHVVSNIILLIETGQELKYVSYEIQMCVLCYYSWQICFIK